MGKNYKEKKINFLKIKDLIRNPELKPSEKCILINLYFYAGTTGNAFPSQKTLAKDLGYKDSRQIRTILNKLKQKGWIKSWDKRGYSKSNLYILNEEIYFHNDISNRNSKSSYVGTELPLQSGNIIPPKVIKESNQINSSEIQQLFEITSNTRCSPTDLRRLNELIRLNSPDLVKDAINEIKNRNYSYIKVGLVARIIDDWKIDGKPLVKPTFKACKKNGCDNGYVLNSINNSFKKCICRETYNQQFEGFKNET